MVWADNSFHVSYNRLCTIFGRSSRLFIAGKASALAKMLRHAWSFNWTHCLGIFWMTTSRCLINVHMYFLPPAMLLVHRVGDTRQFTVSFSWIRRNTIFGLFGLLMKYFAESRVFSCLALCKNMTRKTLHSCSMQYGYGISGIHCSRLYTKTLDVS